MYIGKFIVWTFLQKVSSQFVITIVIQDSYDKGIDIVGIPQVGKNVSLPNQNQLQL